MKKKKVKDNIGSNHSNTRNRFQEVADNQIENKNRKMYKEREIGNVKNEKKNTYTIR